MERKPIHEPRSPHYGSISLVKRMQQQLHPPSRNCSRQIDDGHGESERTPLRTDLSFVRGGQKFRSRDRISRFLDHSTFGIIVDTVLACLSVLYVGTYILTTYTDATTLPTWIWVLELLCATIFAIDFLFRGLYLSNHRLNYMLSLAGSVDLLVILPVLPVSLLHPSHTLWFAGDNWRFVYPFRFVKCYLECRDVLSRCHAYMTPVRQFAILCYTQIVLIIAGAAGIIQVAETSDGSKHSDTHQGDWTFFNAFFNSVLVFVTIETPPADNVLAKVFIGVLVIVLILIVPYQISKVLDLSKSFTEYQLIAFKPARNTKHIVLCGDLTPSRIDYFFREVFHDDHDVVDINVVVLSEEEPSTAMIALLMDPFFEKRASFIQGSILDVDDAERAAVGGADAIFILTRRCDQEEHMASDHRTLMRVLAAKRLAPAARIFAQMHLSSNRHLLEDLNVKTALYFSEVMYSLLGQNCGCPGFSTLIYNLTSTSSEDPDAMKTSDVWQQKYVRSASHEVYAVTLPPATVIFGKTFSEVASLLYEECQGVILFAVQSKALTTHDKILLNPGATYTCSGDEAAFVIATDRREADQAVTKLAAAGPHTRPSAWTSQRALAKLTESTEKRKDPSRRVSKTLHWITSVECRVERVGDDADQTNSSSTPEQPLPRARTPPRARGFSNHRFLTGYARTSIDDVVIEDLSELSISMAHIVLCVVSAKAFPHDVEYLIGPLRVKALHHHRPIVIVTSKLPEDEQYETFRHFKHVFFVKGDPFQPRTLRRASIESAHKIVLMGDEGAMAESGASELLADASCIALHKTMVAMIGPARAPRIITELVTRSNFHFITQNLLPSEWFPPADRDVEFVYTNSVASDDPELAGSRLLPPTPATTTNATAFSREFFMAPAFASGLTYSTSLCDSLMINQYFNPMIKNILREFIFASWKDEDYMGVPATPPSAQLDPTTSPSPTSSSLVSPGGLHRSSLFTIEVPLDFVGKTFAYVFHYLLSSDNILAIGLYRCRPDPALYGGKARVELKEEERSVPFGYVYVNPMPEELLTGNDLLYVLSHKQPRWA